MNKFLTYEQINSYFTLWFYSNINKKLYNKRLEYKTNGINLT